MGKRQHQKDKLYLTYSEWTHLYGGKVDEPEKQFRRIPFDYCCVSFQPFQNPYCDEEGNVFELEPLLLYYKRFKHNPVTGKPMDPKKLVKLKFYKNTDDEYFCPVLYKVFTKQSHIVAIAKTGNVFSYEAVEQLNFKTKNWKDLLTDEPFQRKDVIVLQDPMNLKKFNIAEFHHVKHNLRVLTEEQIAARSSDPENRLKTVSNEARDVLNELNREYKEPEVKPKEKERVPDKFNSAHYSTGMVAAGFTSTVMEPETKLKVAVIHDDIVRYERIKKKGYVRLCTNFGNLNVQLHSDMVPKTCENFIKLCQKGYYDNTVFHRSIRNFMIQGGDPTGSGTGGESYWNKPFEDEFKPNLTHSGRGVLSMANNGPNANGSQFFITFRSCRHLDNKHTVFGQVVGGMDILTQMEQIEVDNKDRPIVDIVLVKTQIFTDPYQEVDEQLNEERRLEDERNKPVEEDKSKTTVTLGDKSKVFKQGVGKYINPELITKLDKKDLKSDDSEPVPKKKNIGYEFRDFSFW